RVGGLDFLEGSGSVKANGLLEAEAARRRQGPGFFLLAETTDHRPEDVEGRIEAALAQDRERRGEVAQTLARVDPADAQQARAKRPRRLAGSPHVLLPDRTVAGLEDRTPWPGVLPVER